MKRITILMSALFFFAGMAMAQSSYKVHTIKEGETLSQLAKKYGTTVGDIMRLNEMTTSSKLSIGEKVKIPASGNDDAASVPTETSHEVQTGETLYQISHKYHVTVANLRDWNNISDNTIKVGQVLRLTAPTENTTATDSTNNIAAQNNNTANQVGDNTDANTIPENNSSDTSASEKQRTESVFDQTATAPVTDEGLYANTYKSQANGTELITKGSSGIFKTASGWQDKKYFILMNEVNPGTVVKVQANGKTIYAKVLWNLGNIKENEGLSYRISDAAAGVLGVIGAQFDLIVSYFK